MTSSMDQEILAGAAGLSPGQFTIQRALQSVRTHLGMDVAYLSEFVGNESVFKAVDAPGLEAIIKPGDRRSLDDVYCRHILDGRLPRLIPDTSEEPLALAMPITQAVPIGSHVSIPIYMPDGQPYGMFCCLSAKPNKSLNPRDLDIMTMFAELATHELHRELSSAQVSRSRQSRIESVIQSGAFSLVYQPICSLRDMQVVGFEALCRFSDEPYRSPDKWFAEAAEAGLGVDLEIAVLERSVQDLQSLPEAAYVSFNASPETVTSGRLSSLFDRIPPGRVVLEVTEHAPVADYDHLMASLSDLRSRGARLAVDDAGAGFASLQHIVRLAPDFIKLDMSLTRDIDTDPARRALASALIFFARETGSAIIAEGIESAGELEIFKLLGVSNGQGYLLGRPMPLADIAGWRDGRPALAS